MKTGESSNESKEVFYEYMKKVTVSSLTYLKEKAKQESIRLVHGSFVQEHVEEILNLPEAISGMSFMLEENFYKKIEIRDDELGDKIIKVFLMEYVERNNGFDFNDTLFRSLYGELEEYIYAEGREFITIAPLLGFKLKVVKSIDLKDFIIRGLTKDEIKMLSKLGEPFLLPSSFLHPSLFDWSFLEAVWCIELRRKSRSKRSAEIPYQDIERIITTLRLFKKGALDYSTTLTYPKVWRRTTGPTVSIKSTTKVGIRDPTYQPYELKTEDVESLPAFWDGFKKLNTQNYPFLDVAIRRFNFSYDRELPEDNLIDFMIAFEALYLSDEERQELKYRLALRCAYFLGKDEKKRKKIFEIIKGAYDVRNEIVHGAPIQSINKTLHKLNLQSLTELSMEIEGYLRDSIKMFFDRIQSKSHEDEDIITEINAKILAGA